MAFIPCFRVPWLTQTPGLFLQDCELLVKGYSFTAQKLRVKLLIFRSPTLWLKSWIYNWKTKSLHFAKGSPHIFFFGHQRRIWDFRQGAQWSFDPKGGMSLNIFSKQGVSLIIDCKLYDFGKILGVRWAQASRIRQWTLIVANKTPKSCTSLWTKAKLSSPELLSRLRSQGSGSTMS